MSEWKECKLGDVANLINGFAFKSVDFSNSGIPVVKIKNIASGKLMFDDVQYYSFEVNSRLKQFVLMKDDILIAMTGSHVYQPSSMVGKVTRYDKPFPALLNQRVGKIVSREPDILSEDFIYYFLRQEDVTIDLAANAGGSANQANISSEQIRNIPFYLPPLPEQRAIADVLSSLDAKIDLLHHQNKTLEEMAEARWRKMFVEEADPGWKKGKLGDLAKETIGGDWGEDEINADLVPVICLRGIDLQDIKDYGFSDRAPLRFIKATSLEKRKINENDILIAGSGIGPIGKSIPINTGMINSYPHPVIYSNFCKRLRCESRSTAYFIEFMIYELYQAGELDQFHMGTSLPNFNMKGFLNFDIIIPSNEVIERFSSFLTDWYNLKYANQIRTLSHLRDILLPKLMSGKVRVRI